MEVRRQIGGVYEVDLQSNHGLYGTLRVIRDGRKGWSARTRTGFVVFIGSTLAHVLDQLERFERGA